MAIAEAVSVVSTLKSAADLIEKLRKTESKEELRDGAAALADMLWTARAAAVDLIEQKALLIDERARLNERISALERENHRLIDFGDQSEKYERFTTPMGQFVYREKAAVGGNGGPPYYCPKCYANAKASILQCRHGDSFHKCPACEWHAFL